MTQGNLIDLLPRGRPPTTPLLEAIRAAKHHVHLADLHLRADATGDEFLDALDAQGQGGVESACSTTRWVAPPAPPPPPPAARAGGQEQRVPADQLGPPAFADHMRNHRKIAGGRRRRLRRGLNVATVRRQVARFASARHAHRLRGPAVSDLQRVFAEGLEFASDER